MPRNLFGGNKAKRGKNAPRRDNNRALLMKDKNDECQMYAKVMKRLGGNPPILTVMCEDGKERSVVVRGKFAKKVWMNPDDIVLITSNIDSGESGEITCKYNPSEVSRLEQLGEISSKSFGDDPGKDSNIVFTNHVDMSNEVDDYYSNIDISGNEAPAKTVAALEEGDEEAGGDIDSDELNIDDI